MSLPGLHRGKSRETEFLESTILILNTNVYAYPSSLNTLVKNIINSASILSAQPGGDCIS